MQDVDELISELLLLLSNILLSFVLIYSSLFHSYYFYNCYYQKLNGWPDAD